MKHSILLLLLTAAFRLAGNSPAPEIAWEFDPAFGVKEQGLELNGFDSMKVLPEGTLPPDCGDDTGGTNFQVI